MLGEWTLLSLWICITQASQSAYLLEKIGLVHCTVVYIRYKSREEKEKWIEIRIDHIFYTSSEDIIACFFLKFFEFFVFCWVCRNVFKRDDLGLEILRIAFPAALALAADPIASLIDTAFIGHLGMPSWLILNSLDPWSKSFCLWCMLLLPMKKFEKENHHLYGHFDTYY